MKLKKKNQKPTEERWNFFMSKKQVLELVWQHLQQVQVLQP